MPRVHPAWSRATSLADLGQLTADWLEGKIDKNQNGDRFADDDPETTPLVATLVHLNRAGFLTVSSQPWADGRGIKQRAAVQGFATDRAAAQLTRAARRANLIVSEGQWHIVTTAHGKPVCAFGERTRPIDLHAEWASEISPKAFRQLSAAREIAIIADDWGPRGDRLWGLLATAVSR